MLALFDKLIFCSKIWVLSDIFLNWETSSVCYLLNIFCLQIAGISLFMCRIDKQQMISEDIFLYDSIWKLVKIRANIWNWPYQLYAFVFTVCMKAFFSLKNYTENFFVKNINVSEDSVNIHDFFLDTMSIKLFHGFTSLI